MRSLRGSESEELLFIPKVAHAQASVVATTMADLRDRIELAGHIIQSPKHRYPMVVELIKKLAQDSERFEECPHSRGYFPVTSLPVNTNMTAAGLEGQA